MKKILSLLTLLMCCSLCGYGQFTNASASLIGTGTAPLAPSDTWAVLWGDFQIIDSLPSDAVVVTIRPVLIASGFVDAMFHTASYGKSVGFNVPGCTSVLNNFSIPTAFPSVSTPGAFPSTEFYAVDTGITLSDLPSQRVCTGMGQTLLHPSGLLDTIFVTGVGFAIYYTSATPSTDATMPPPFAVPAGQGLAWALPVSVLATSSGSFPFPTIALPATSSSPQKNIVGTINNPNGTGINGFLHMSLPSGTIKNICVTPNLIVPKISSTYKIVNGVPQFPANARFTSNDCLYPRVVYNIEVDDAQNNLKYQDNWYLPQSTDIIYDIGDFSQANYGGPITVSVPKAIVSNPAVSQVIAQPTGTSLSLNGTIIINGQTFATAAGGVTYTGLLLTAPTLTQILTQPGGTFLNLVGDIRINGTTFGAGVTSFNSRSGAVTPTSGDYSCGMVTGSICSLGSVNYQTVQSNTSNMPVEPKLNFSSEFALSDNSTVATNVALATTAVTAGTYNFPSQIIVNSKGLITSITAAGTLPVDISQSVVTGSRTFGSTFHNTSSSTLLATGFGTTSGSSTGQITCSVGPSSPTQQVWSNQVTATVSSGHAGFMCPVPSGYFYSVSVTGAISTTPGLWVESTY